MSNWTRKLLPKRWKTTKQAGDHLELRVVAMYKRFHKWGVKKQHFLVDRFGNLSEIDVVYGIFFKRYIECKNYSNKPVPFSDVAKFKSVLELNNIPVSRGIFITTSTFTPRCRMIGIRCIDGQQLRNLERLSYIYDAVYSAMKGLSLAALAAITIDIYRNPKRYEPVYKLAKRGWSFGAQQFTQVTAKTMVWANQVKKTIFN